MNRTYSVGVLLLVCIVVHSQGFQVAPITESFSGFAYPESGEQDPGRQNAMVRICFIHWELYFYNPSEFSVTWVGVAHNILQQLFKGKTHSVRNKHVPLFSMKTNVSQIESIDHTVRTLYCKL